jgi:hypothetical protein
MGETYIYLGNLADAMDDSEETEEDDEEEAKSTPFYNKALDCFRRCQESDPEALPERFVEFVQEFEKDE